MNSLVEEEVNIYMDLSFVNFENLLFQEHWAKDDLYTYTVTVVFERFIPLHFTLNSLILLKSGKY